MEDLSRTDAARFLASLRPKTPKRCDHCARRFTATKRGKYCSPACRTAAYRERKRNETP